MITLTISKLRFPNNGNISNPITVSLYIRPYYSDSFTLIDSGVNVGVDGTILDSPLPTTSIEPTEKYVLRAVNELCGFEYEQSVIINPYCPVGWDMAPDSSYCFIEEVTDATPPTAGENTIAKTLNVYSTCGSYIYDPGYNVNGTGTSTQISLANPFWVNGPGTCGTATTTDGPMNRNGLWATTLMNNQDIGFAVCIEIPETKTYHVGIGCDNFAIIKVNGEIVVQQNEAAIDAQYGNVGSCFKVFHIYPVVIPAGSTIIELIGHNVSSAAGLACEIYDNTAAEIAAATGYGGLNMIFRSADYIGQPVVLGTGGLGFSCPAGYSLRACESPISCVRLLTTPILY